VRRLSGALQAAHDRGIVHRDLKPSNILFNAHGEPVVLDFGLARRLQQGGARLTQAGQPVGTPAYMSPEQVAGAVGQMGPACDVYALGVILYQLLTGRLPFEGTLAEVLAQIVTRPPEPPSRWRPGLDPRLEAICLQALSKDVHARFASMRDLGGALAGCLPGKVPAPPPARGPWARLRWPGLLAGSVAAAGLMAGVLFWPPKSTGTVRIELDDPRAAVEVQVDGERRDPAGLGEPLQLPAGRHQLLVTSGRFKSVSESFTVEAGDNTVLRVKLVPRAEAPANPVAPANPIMPPRATRPTRATRPDDDQRKRQKERETRGDLREREVPDDD
jgi:hypothetical protein